MSKFKVGDKVKVIGIVYQSNYTDVETPVNSIVTITKIHSNSKNYYLINNGNFYNQSTHFELYKPKPTKDYHPKWL